MTIASKQEPVIYRYNNYDSDNEMLDNLCVAIAKEHNKTSYSAKTAWEIDIVIISAEGPFLGALISYVKEDIKHNRTMQKVLTKTNIIKINLYSETQQHGTISLKKAIAH